MTHASLIAEFDRLIRRDPARRGLISGEAEFGPLCVGHLHGAAEELAARSTLVVLVTGFFIPRAEPPCAETDGPPGTLLLAAALQAAGIETRVLTDEFCLPAVRAADEGMEYARGRMLAHPHTCGAWVEEFLASEIGRRMSHLIAIERAGPSHTAESVQAQRRDGLFDVGAFRAACPVEGHGCCHNRRGDNIDAHTGDTYRLFDAVREHRPDVRTIGVGDGGNEIGMGCIPWEELRRRLAGEQGGRIPCRVATDWNIIAGTSNWGAQSLAAATLVLRGQAEQLQPWDGEQQRRALEHLVAHGPAVDGITRQREATVDGLPFLTYIQPWEGIRRLLGFDHHSADLPAGRIR